jgi:hypothetical protein
VEIKLGELLKRATQVMMTMMMMMLIMMMLFFVMIMMMMMTAIMMALLLMVSLVLPRLMPMLNFAVQAAITSLWATFQQLKFGSSKVVPKDGTPYGSQLHVTSHWSHILLAGTVHEVTSLYHPRPFPPANLFV